MDLQRRTLFLIELDGIVEMKLPVRVFGLLATAHSGGEGVVRVFHPP